MYLFKKIIINKYIYYFYMIKKYIKKIIFILKKNNDIKGNFLNEDNIKNIIL